MFSLCRARTFPAVLLVLLFVLGMLGLAAFADPVATITLATPAVHVDEQDGIAVIIVNRLGDLTRAVAVDYALVPITATPGLDYEEFIGTLTFAPRQSLAGFAVPIFDDSHLEGEEQVGVMLSSPAGGILGSPSTTMITIRDEDGEGGEPEFEVTDVAVAEGEAATLTVTRTGDVSGSATVAYSTEDGTALAGDDYTRTVDSLYFAPEEASQTLTISTLNDSRYEGSESFTIRISGPAGVGIGAQTVTTVTITDDPADQVRFQFRNSNFSVQEDAGTTSITVTRTGDPQTFASVAYFTADGTATEPDDYGTSSGTLEFPVGVTERSF